MKVKAIAMGQYKNHIIERGAEFHIDNPREFSRRWMEQIAEDKPVDRRSPENADDRQAIEEQLKAEDLGVTQ